MPMVNWTPEQYEMVDHLRVILSKSGYKLVRFGMKGKEMYFIIEQAKSK